MALSKADIKPARILAEDRGEAPTAMEPLLLSVGSPFLDGNGRVARLMSHAVLMEALARAQAEYKAHLSNCDGPRRTDLDGRGSLSEEALADFTKFFLETCLDQVRFMASLMQPARLRDRILIWTEEEGRAGALPQKAGQLLEAVLYRGVLRRVDVLSVLSTSERSARRVVSSQVGERRESAKAVCDPDLDEGLAGDAQPPGLRVDLLQHLRGEVHIDPLHRAPGPVCGVHVHVRADVDASVVHGVELTRRDCRARQCRSLSHHIAPASPK